MHARSQPSSFVRRSDSEDTVAADRRANEWTVQPERASGSFGAVGSAYAGGRLARTAGIVVVRLAPTADCGNVRSRGTVRAGHGSSDQRQRHPYRRLSRIGWSLHAFEVAVGIDTD